MILLNGVGVTITMFPDGTSQVWKLPDGLVKDRDNEVIWVYSHEAELIHLAQLECLLQHDGTRYLDIPYLPYARQDKAVDNKATFAFWPFAELLNTAWMEGDIFVFDPHNYDAIEEVGWSITTPEKEIADAFKQSGATTICYPDEGARDRYSDLLDFKHQILQGVKTRDQQSGDITGLEIIGDPTNKDILIVDDICDGGATFIKLAEYLKGAASISLYVSHGIFSRGVKVLRDAGIKRIFTKDGEVVS